MYLRVDVKRRCLVAFAAGAAFAGLMFSDSLAQPPRSPAVTATNAFALDLYRELAQDSRNDGDNLWFSPYSITSALAMTAEGARGNTRAQMANTLHFGDPLQLTPIHEGVGALDRQLNTGVRSESPSAAGVPTVRTAAYELSVANALWGEQAYPFDADYVSTIAQHYGVSGVFAVDFLHNAESARSRINAWIEKQTRGKITNLLSPGSVDQDTRLVLTNAVYFKGPWAFPFNGRATVSQPFHLDVERSVSVRMMRNLATLGYFEDDEAQVLWLNFGARASRDMSMVIVLPRRVDGLADIEKVLSGEVLDEWTRAPVNRLVEVHLPKFKMETEAQLVQLLRRMGMSDAFDRQTADFSGMSPVGGVDELHISQVIHKAYLAVDEEGAEAAAATAVAMMGGAGGRGPVTPVIVRADHPFLVLIRHNPSGTILFLGRLMDPSDG